MKWDEMTPEDRDALVAVKVMGRELAIPYETYHRYLWKNERGIPGLTEDTPHYSQSMDGAWQVLNKMSDMQTDSEHLGELTPQFEVFSDLLFEGWVQASTHGDLYPGYRIIEIAAAWTPESLCKAALQACGVDI